MFSATAARKNCSRTNFNLRRRKATQFDLILEFREQEFGNDSGKHTQWRAFLGRSALTQAPENLAGVVEQLRTFFEPILGALA
jgi:hypothetical protein